VVVDADHKAEQVRDAFLERHRIGVLGASCPARPLCATAATPWLLAPSPPMRPRTITRPVSAGRRTVCAGSGATASIPVATLPHEAVPEHIRAFDAALVPDTTYWSSPAKLFEYQACGIPVLAPSYPAIHEAMASGSEGFIFEPLSVGQMADRALEITPV